MEVNSVFFSVARIMQTPVFKYSLYSDCDCAVVFVVFARSLALSWMD